MSAVRLGPVMKLITAPRAAGSGARRATPRATTPTCASDSTSAVAVEHARRGTRGSSEVERGRPGRRAQAPACRSPRSRGPTPVTPRSASRDRHRAGAARSPAAGRRAGIVCTARFRPRPARGVTSTPSAGAVPASPRCGRRARARCAPMTSGTSAAVAHPVEARPPPARTRVRNRSRVCGQRSVSSRRSDLEPLARPGRARRRRGRNEPARPAPSRPRMRARNSARVGHRRLPLERRPPLLERARRHRRQIARARPVAEEERQRADRGRRARTAAGTGGASGAAQTVERGPAQEPAEGLEDHALGPRRDLPLGRPPCAARSASAGCRFAPGRRPGTRRTATRRARDPSPTPVRSASRSAGCRSGRDTCSRRRGRRSAGTRGRRSGRRRSAGSRAPRAACRRSASIRPLSSRTRWNSSGPSSSAGRRGPCTSVVYDGQLLPGRALGQHGQEDHEVGHRRHDLLHAHDGHVHARQRRDHAPVALVGDQHDGARVGHREVRAGDPEIRLQELLAQLGAGDPR